MRQFCLGFLFPLVCFFLGLRGVDWGGRGFGAQGRGATQEGGDPRKVLATALLKLRGLRSFGGHDSIQRPHSRPETYCPSVFSVILESSPEDVVRGSCSRRAHGRRFFVCLFRTLSQTVLLEAYFSAPEAAVACRGTTEVALQTVLPDTGRKLLWSYQFICLF